MVTVFKKVEKSSENPIGYEEVSPGELDKPFLFCMTAQDMNKKSVLGGIRAGVQGARAYTLADNGAGYKVEDMPVDFLGYLDHDEDKVGKIVNGFLYPFLTKEGMDKEKLAKRAEMMNFMTFCDGFEDYRNIEISLKQRLLQDGLNEDEIKEIISNIKLMALATDRDTTKLDCTSIEVVDVNDFYALQFELESKRKMEESGEEALTGIYADNHGYYCYNGTGNHDFKENFNGVNKIRPIVNYIISKMIEASIHGRKLSINEMLDGIRDFSTKGNTVEELFNVLDNEIDYGNVSKYTGNELKLRKELDKICEKYEKEHMEKENALNSYKDVSNKNRKLIDAIKKYSSDITFLQIAMEAIGWNRPEPNFEPNDYLSDREIRESFVKEEKPKQL